MLPVARRIDLIPPMRFGVRKSGNVLLDALLTDGLRMNCIYDPPTFSRRTSFGPQGAGHYHPEEKAPSGQPQAEGGDGRLSKFGETGATRSQSAQLDE